jgi:hypothetical protein
VPRRVSLPGADELFRRTTSVDAAGTEVSSVANGLPSDVEPIQYIEPRHAAEPDPEQPRRSSGRVRHDEKITVYVTAEELLDVEHARLVLRRHHGIATDRGRLIREAVSIVLADLEVNGEGSVLVDRMRE